MSKPDPNAIPTTLDFRSDASPVCYTLYEYDPTAPGDKLEQLGEAGEKAIDEQRRIELLRGVRQGEPHELIANAIVFRQSNTPRPLPESKAKEANRNFFHFAPAEVAAFARTFEGVQFLRDHDRRHLEAVGGHVLLSEAEELGDWTVFRQLLHLVKPWAVEGALDGTLQTFSISWDRVARGMKGLRQSLYCTVCDEPFWGGDCKHFPGDVVKFGKNGERAIVELQWRGVVGAETSAVSFPAVEQTEIADIRAALMAARSDQFPHKEPLPMSLEKVRSELGLPPDATAEEILEAQQRRLAEQAQEIEAERLSRESVQFALDKQREERAQELAERRKAQVAALREDALNRGLITPGDQRDKLFLELCEADVDRGERFLKTLEPAVPVGQPRQLDTPPEPAESDDDREVKRILVEEYGASELEVEIQAKQFRQLGLTPADFLKHGQHTRWLDSDGEEG